MHPLAGGAARGTPIVRYYWARFLVAHRGDIRGVALEVGTTATIKKYAPTALDRADALDLVAHSPEVSVVADLSRASHLPADTYDCFVNQFTMHVIYDVEAALHHSLRVLKAGGVLLINFACLDYYFARGLDMQTGAPLYVHHWFTPIQVENLLRGAGLSSGDFEIRVFGNLFAQIAHQLNMSAEELTERELDFVDDGYPLLICARAVKPADWAARAPKPKTPWLPDATPARWDPVTGHIPR
jgi:SAM-dependent methyltransferase